MISVIGDVMLDEFWFGEVHRKSPENANTPIVKVNNKKASLGGAANVALNIHKLEQKVNLLGILGNDTSKDSILELIEKENLSFTYAIDKNTPTTRKIRVFDNSTYLYRTDIEGCAQDFQKFLQDDMSKEYVVISDYNKGTIKDAQKIIDYCKYSFVDPKAPLDYYKNAFVLKPNFKEFIEWSGLTSEYTIEAFIHTNYFNLVNIRKNLKVEYLIITAGSEGCILVTEKVRHFKADKVEEVDVTGAGDTFLAGLVCKFKETNDIVKAVKFANLVASIAVSKKGTAYVTKQETA